MKNNLQTGLILLLCGLISGSVVANVVSFLDGQAPRMTSAMALEKAQQSAARYCGQKGSGKCDLQLVDAVAQPDGRWQFEFSSERFGPVRIQVQENEARHLLTRVEPAR
jgi:hypothetical protein